MSDDTETIHTAAEPPPVVAESTELVATNHDEYLALKAEQQAEEQETAGYHVVEVRDQKFRLRNEISAMLLLDLAGLGDDMTPEIERVRAIRDFMGFAAIDEDAQAFNRFIRLTKPPLSMEELNTLVQDMVMKYSGRPTTEQ